MVCIVFVDRLVVKILISRKVVVMLVTILFYSVHNHFSISLINSFNCVSEKVHEV